MSGEKADFSGQVALIATMHGKQAAFAPPLERLGFTVLTPQGFDTDRFGTFTGEVERSGDMLDAARAKARAAFLHSGQQGGWVIASEGAFGPSQAVPMLAEARELALAWRPDDDLEIVETRMSFETNFSHLDLSPDVDASGWLERIGFPDHAVIVREGHSVVEKGIQSETALNKLASTISGPIRLETDMRAHLNQTRMRELSVLGEILGRRLGCCCPKCAQPGFGRVQLERGLPCQACGTPTDLVMREIWRCAACDHGEKRPRADGLTQGAPGDCGVCNP